MTTFTEDQIKKIRETLGDEAVTKLTLPKVRVPKCVTGQWLEDHAQAGVEVTDFDGDWVAYYEDWGWAGHGYRPPANSARMFTIEEWPNGEIYDNCPPPERAEIAENTEASGGGELKVGDAVKSIDQLDSLPSGSVIARDERLPWSKVGNGDWVHPWEKESAYSEDVFSNMMTSDLTILRVGWES